jgi:hypothetical protein
MMHGSIPIHNLERRTFNNPNAFYPKDMTQELVFPHGPYNPLQQSTKDLSLNFDTLKFSLKWGAPSSVLVISRFVKDLEAKENLQRV